MGQPCTTPSGRSCGNCGYALDGLTCHRCPECGRGFNPNDSKTYVQNIEWKFDRHALVAALGLLATFLISPLIDNRSTIGMMIFPIVFFAGTWGVSVAGSIRGKGANRILSVIIALICTFIIGLIVISAFGLHL